MSAWVFFDLDGVVIDSELAILTSANGALRDLGLSTIDAERIRKFIGPPIHQAFSALTGEKVESALVGELVASYRRHYVSDSLVYTTLYDGIPEALLEIASRFATAAVTSKPRVYSEAILDALFVRSHLPSVFGPELGAVNEPKSITMNRALTFARSRGGERFLMVGDRSHDAEAASRHGISCVGVAWGAGSVSELLDAGVAEILTHASELPAAVDRWSATI